MCAALIVDVGMMLLSAFLNLSAQHAVTEIAVVGGIPALAIGVVSAIEAGVTRRNAWRRVAPGDELRNLAMRLSAGGR
jgi:hypothetical protein